MRAWLERAAGRRAWWLWLLVGLLVRTVDVWHPVDGGVRESWREADVAAIARNFYREDDRLAYPRIDWRRDGPGFVESEFPLYPWLVAQAWRAFGYHETWLRVFSLLTAVAALAVFAALARDLLAAPAATLALAFFALAPLAVRMASAIQPEPLMLLCYVAGIRWFLRWLRGSGARDWGLALLATTLALLVKITAAVMGLLFAALAWDRWRWRMLRRPSLWVFALVALGLTGWWYGHAHGLWRQYGNSLGISNEGYVRIVSLDFLRSAWRTVPGVLLLETAFVWTPFGLALLWLARRALRPRDWPGRVLGYWLAALALFYFVTGRTTGEYWATYYHVLSVPLAALVFGRAAAAMAGPSAAGGRRARWGAVLVGLVLLYEGAVVAWDAHPRRFEPHYRDALAFARVLPPGAPIAVLGPSVRDRHGLLRASDPSYFFFWLDRRGWVVHAGPGLQERLAALPARGVRYLIVERHALRKGWLDEDWLRRCHRLLVAGRVALLYDIGDGRCSRTVASPGG